MRVIAICWSTIVYTMHTDMTCKQPLTQVLKVDQCELNVAIIPWVKKPSRQLYSR